MEFGELNEGVYLNRAKAFNFGTITAGVLGTGIIFLVCRYLSLQILFAPILILTVFLSLWLNESKPQVLKYLLIGSGLFLTFHFFYTVSKSYSRIPEWDYIAFYLYSLAGQSGCNFYDPELFRELFSSYRLGLLTGHVFFEEVVNVGFPYPPPSMILFFPLGWVDLKTGYYIWQSILLLFLLGAIWLSIDIFSFKRRQREDKILYALLLIHLILLFPGVTSSFRFTQTNPALLFSLLLVIKRLKHWDAGLYLIIMIMIKPLAVLFAFYFLLKKRWDVIAAASISGILILAFTGIIFGFDIFVQYFTSLPSNRLPEWVYSQKINNSLSAVFLRLHTNQFAFLDQAAINTLILVVSLVLLLITLVISWRLERKSSRLSFLVFIPFSLLVYPAALAHYSLLLIPVILVLREQHQFFHMPAFLFLLVSIYIIANLNMFYLNMLLLSSFAYLSLVRKSGNTELDYRTKHSPEAANAGVIK
jgi:hypothetical protein